MVNIDKILADLSKDFHYYDDLEELIPENHIHKIHKKNTTESNHDRTKDKQYRDGRSD